MYLLATSLSAGVGESTRTDATDDGDGASASVPLKGESASDRRGPDASDGSVVPDESAGDGTDESGADTVRTRLIESTAVAAITGAFIVLDGSTQVAPDLSLPIALAGVLWLFVRTLPPMRRRSDDGTPDSRETAYGGDGSDAVDPRPAAKPISTDRRLKLEIADHGGRMMQKELVASVDLSESAVSRRLSKLENDGKVGRVCLGRENLVYLEGSQPDGADSPFAEG